MPRINYTTKELYAGTIVKAVGTIITDITLYTLSAAEFVSQCFHQQGLNRRNVDVKRYWCTVRVFKDLIINFPMKQVGAIWDKYSWFYWILTQHFSLALTVRLYTMLGDMTCATQERCVWFRIPSRRYDYAHTLVLLEMLWRQIRAITTHNWPIFHKIFTHNTIGLANQISYLTPSELISKLYKFDL